MDSVIINIIIGIISGVLSGIIVYVWTQNLEKNRTTYYILSDYLYKTIERFGVEIPSELLRYAKNVGDRNTAWGKAFDNILDITRKYELEEREFTPEEEELAKNVLIAIKELGSWGVKKHILPKKKSKQNE